jgi:hypothetical protein
MYTPAASISVLIPSMNLDESFYSNRHPLNSNTDTGQSTIDSNQSPTEKHTLTKSKNKKNSRSHRRKRQRINKVVSIDREGESSDSLEDSDNQNSAEENRDNNSSNSTTPEKITEKRFESDEAFQPVVMIETLDLKTLEESEINDLKQKIDSEDEVESESETDFSIPPPIRDDTDDEDFQPELNIESDSSSSDRENKSLKKETEYLAKNFFRYVSQDVRVIWSKSRSDKSRTWKHLNIKDLPQAIQRKICDYTDIKNTLRLNCGNTSWIIAFSPNSVNRVSPGCPKDVSMLEVTPENPPGFRRIPELTRLDRLINNQRWNRTFWRPFDSYECCLN